MSRDSRKKKKNYTNNVKCSTIFNLFMTAINFTFKGIFRVISAVCSINPLINIISHSIHNQYVPSMVDEAQRKRNALLSGIRNK